MTGRPALERARALRRWLDAQGGRASWAVAEANFLHRRGWTAEELAAAVAEAVDGAMFESDDDGLRVGP